MPFKLLISKELIGHVAQISTIFGGQKVIFQKFRTEQNKPWAYAVSCMKVSQPLRFTPFLADYKAITPAGWLIEDNLLLS